MVFGPGLVQTSLHNIIRIDKNAKFKIEDVEKKYTDTDVF